ncbi:heparanase-like isoform X2 [Amphiura filiformis]|uniref:heparanase-like isoform X2 n=1 Tax=Amphiura filiformis TaxID=82378 RepID=UPI003B214684
MGLLVVHVNCCTYRQIGNIIEPSSIFSQKLLQYLKTDRFFFTLDNSSISGLVSITSSESLHVVDSRFLSIALGSSLIRDGWRQFDFNSDRLKNLARALSPAILRLGGTDADFLIFNSTQGQPTGRARDDEQGSAEDTRYNKHDFRNNFTMSVSDWDNINTFAADVGWDMLFDLNMLLRNHTSWDPTNARALLKYSTKKGYRIAGWELGNEPNHIRHHSNVTIHSYQLGKDFVTLRKLLDQYGYQDSFLIGPDITKPVLNKALDVEDDIMGQSPLEFLRSFLKFCGNSTYATTWHSYSLDGRVATADNFTDPGLMNDLKKEIKQVHDVIRRYRPFLPKSWLGETAGAYGGGAPGLSNAYAGGFLWLDKLGVSAASGIDLIFRQTFYGGRYGLIGKDLKPTPVYWLSFAYKQLVGPIVLNVSVSITTDASDATDRTPTHIRAYAHCTNNRTRLGSSYSNGSVTLFVLNLQKSNHINLTLGGDLRDKSVDQYLLAPHRENITSTTVNLNGRKLKLTGRDTIPFLHGQPLAKDTPISIPPLTYGFYVIDANATACQ